MYNTIKHILQRLTAFLDRILGLSDPVDVNIPITEDPLAGGKKLPSYLTRFDESGAISFHLPHEIVIHGCGPIGVNRRSWVYEQVLGCVGEKVADIVIDCVEYEDVKGGFDWSVSFMVYTKVRDPFGKVVKMN